MVYTFLYCFLFQRVELFPRSWFFPKVELNFFTWNDCSFPRKLLILCIIKGHWSFSTNDSSNAKKNKCIRNNYIHQIRIIIVQKVLLFGVIFEPFLRPSHRAYSIFWHANHGLYRVFRVSISDAFLSSFWAQFWVPNPHYKITILGVENWRPKNGPKKHQKWLQMGP